MISLKLQGQWIAYSLTHKMCRLFCNLSFLFFFVDLFDYTRKTKHIRPQMGCKSRLHLFVAVDNPIRTRIREHFHWDSFFWKNQICLDECISGDPDHIWRINIPSPSIQYIIIQQIYKELSIFACKGLYRYQQLYWFVICRSSAIGMWWPYKRWTPTVLV